MEYNPKRIFYLERYYLDLVQHQGANETYKREKFLVLLSELFPAQKDEVAKYIEGSETRVVIKTKPGKGSIDAYYGNLIIEFERDLSIRAKYEEGRRQVCEYVSGLWNEEGKNRRHYIGIVTDGLTWTCWHPRTIQGLSELKPSDIELVPKEEIILTSAEPSALEEFYHFLDRIDDVLFIIHKDNTPMTEMEFGFRLEMG